MQADDQIIFTFTVPTYLEEFCIQTGKEFDDKNTFIDKSAIVVVQPLFPEKVKITNLDYYSFKPIIKADGSIIVAHFNSRGVAEASLGSPYGPIRSLVIVFPRDHPRFVLRKISIKVLSTHMETKPCCEKKWENPFADGSGPT